MTTQCSFLLDYESMTILVMNELSTSTVILKSALIVCNYVNESNYHTPLRNPIILTAMIVSTISMMKTQH